jgi:hypothetical protein
MSQRRFFHHAVLVCIATLLPLGCKKAVPTEPLLVAALTVVQGNFQSVQAGKELPTPVILRVTDKSGIGMADIPVTLVIGEGGGSADPPSARSDAKGEVKAKWTLGPAVPGQTLVASAPGVSSVSLHAVAILPSDIVISQGNNQSAKAGLAVANAIVVRVVAVGNVPMSGITVAFQIGGGGGAISPQTALTNALGEATARWTLGLQPGTNTAIVSASTLTPVVLTATATP